MSKIVSLKKEMRNDNWRDEKKELDTNTTWFKKFYDDNKLETRHKKTIFIVDCDGVMTDGRSYFDKDGKYAKSYGSYDKEAIQFAVDVCKDQIIFVTDDKEGFPITSARIDKLIDSVSESNNIAKSKMNWKEREMLVMQIRDESYFNKIDVDIVFIGDSFSDIPAMSRADYAFTTNNAPKQVREYANYTSTTNGGIGALSEIIFTYYEMARLV